MSQTLTKGMNEPTYYPEERAREVTGWVGWVGFAGILMILDGIFQAIAGLVGIFRSSFYLVTDNSQRLLIFSNVRAWGWVNLIVGIVVLMGGIALFSGATWARVLAVIMAIGAAIANLLSITLYPVWSIIGITLAVLVLYAVIVHGGELKEANY